MDNPHLPDDYLDKETTPEPKNTGSTNESKSGHEIDLYEPTPWPEAVNGADVLDEAANLLKRHMVMTDADIYACVLWAAHTYLFKLFPHTPRLLITAPDAECGKTLLMTHMVGNLITKPQPVELMSPAPFFRLAEKYQPTFLIDEADIFFRSDSDLPAAINGGFESHGRIPRCVGKDHDVRFFSTHCPVAMAGINIEKKIPSSTLSRCIVISLDRAIGDEIPHDDIYSQASHKNALLAVGKKLARWANDNEDRIAKLKPELPDGVRNRTADKWSPLFSIAQAAGGRWPECVITALSGQADLSEPTKAQILLSDIHDIMKLNFDRKIPTVDLIEQLCRLEDSPWKEYNFKDFDREKRRISTRQLSKLLKLYKISSKSIRIGMTTSKGFVPL